MARTAVQGKCMALRAALEHVLFAEVEFREGSPLDENAAKRVEIPASDTYDNFAAWTKAHAKNGPQSLQPGTELVRRIHDLQPFHRTSAPQEHPLARLVLHTNHAKHRTPAITRSALPRCTGTTCGHARRDLPPRPEEPLRVGAVIAETPIGIEIPATIPR